MNFQFAECDAYESGQRFLDSSDPRLIRHYITAVVPKGATEGTITVKTLGGLLNSNKIFLNKLVKSQ